MPSQVTITLHDDGMVSVTKEGLAAIGRWQEAHRKRLHIRAEHAQPGEIENSPNLWITPAPPPAELKAVALELLGRIESWAKDAYVESGCPPLEPGNPFDDIAAYRARIEACAGAIAWKIVDVPQDSHDECRAPHEGATIRVETFPAGTLWSELPLYAPSRPKVGPTPEPNAYRELKKRATELLREHAGKHYPCAPAELKAVALELLEKWRDSEGSAIGYECEGRTYQERADCVAACDAQFAEYKARIEAAEPEGT